MRLTDGLAIYGASLSTATAVWNYFRSRSQVRVVLIYALETIQGESQHGIGISIQNISTQTVHISNVSFLYPFRKSTFWDKVKHLITFRRIPRNDGWCHSDLSLHGVADGCPTSIEPGKSHWIFVRHEVLEQFLEDAQSRRLRAVVQDALWRNTYSKSFEYPKQTKGTRHRRIEEPAGSAGL
jgi:hypothetical protein